MREGDREGGVRWIVCGMCYVALCAFNVARVAWLFLPVVYAVEVLHCMFSK